jgi:hypothetical protein
MKDVSVPPAAGRVFISYRREETAWQAGWLFDRLVDRFGRDQIFKDIDSIELGDDFVEVITAAVGSCDVLLALIGDRWLTVTDGQGNARLDNPDDFVRLEIEAALTRDVRVIPILVGRAGMPRAEELPANLAKLVRRNALELSPSHFESDTGRLLKVLERTLADVHAQPVVAEPDVPVATWHARLRAPHVEARAEMRHEPPKRGNGGKIVAIIVAALGVIALGLGAFLAFGGNNKNDSGQTTNRSSQTASSPSVAPSSEPSSDTSSPTTDTTTGTDKASQDQKDAAKVIEDFFHRAGARGTAFCDDADAADVQKLWSIPCYRIDPYTSAQRTQMLAISIEARDIILHGNVGAATMYKPVNLVKFWGPIQVRKNCKTLWNGAQWCAWKVRL